MKVLHILYQSYPNISGSSTRTKDILINQKKFGLSPICITSPFQKGEKVQNGIEMIFGIKYYRCYNNVDNYIISEDNKGLFSRLGKLTRILNFQKIILKIVKSESPDILHAHAMFFCAIPAIRIGRMYNIPVIYEVRSLWEDRRKDSNPFNLYYQLENIILRAIETYCMKKANHIVSISEKLKDDIVKRGISSNKISVVGNAVDLEFIEKQNFKINKRVNSSLNFGYIGSISPIEGLSILIELFKEKFEGLNLLIYGSGKISEVQGIITQIGNSKNIKYFGLLKREEIYKAYENIDVIINPRIMLPITDTITPLKPLEAMAFGKIVIASDVGGMKELIIDGYNGFLFKSGSILDLEYCIKRVLHLENNENESIRKNSKNFINNKKSWLINAGLYSNIYKQLKINY